MLVLLVLYLFSLVFGQSADPPYALTAENRDALLNLHNQIRDNYGLSHLTWDPTLEDSATSWARGCVWKHSGSGPGENLSMRWYKPKGGTKAPYSTMKQLFIGWFDEETYWNCTANDCQPGAACGHFTQLIWAATSSVGCGIGDCPSLNTDADTAFLVCQYQSPGNYIGKHPLNPTKSTYDGTCPVGRTRDPVENPTTPVSTPTAPTPPLGTVNPVASPSPVPTPPPTPTPVGMGCTCDATVAYKCAVDPNPIPDKSGWVYCKIDPKANMLYGVINWLKTGCTGAGDLQECQAGKTESVPCLMPPLPAQYFVDSGDKNYYCFKAGDTEYVYKVNNIGTKECSPSLFTSDTVAGRLQSLPLGSKIAIGVGCGVFVLLAIGIIIFVVKKNRDGSNDEQEIY